MPRSNTVRGVGIGDALIQCPLLPCQHAGDLIEVLTGMAVSTVRTHSATLGAAQTFAAPVVEAEVTGTGESRPHWLAPGARDTGIA